MARDVTREAQAAQAIGFMVRLLEFYTHEEAERWMDSPHPDLGGNTPIREIGMGNAAKVDVIIDRLESGAHL